MINPRTGVANWNCEGTHCVAPLAQVRLLPTGTDSNAILCYPCYQHELAYRRERNKELGKACQFKLPDWESLKIYD